MTVQPNEQPTGNGNDASAQAEAASIGAGTLEEDAAKKQAARDELYRDHIKWAIIAVLWLAVLSFIAAIAALVWHYLAPASSHWLTVEQVEKVQTIVFTSAAASSVRFFAKKHI